MKYSSVNFLPLELSYTVPKPFFTDPEQAHVELPPYFETDPRSGSSNRSVPVHVEAFVPSSRSHGPQPPFETIEFALYGAIKSQINSKVTIQKVSPNGHKTSRHFTSVHWCRELIHDFSKARSSTRPSFANGLTSRDITEARTAVQIRQVFDIIVI